MAFQASSPEERSDHYEEMAEEAEVLALMASSDSLKSEYVRIAAAWRRLAQYASDPDTIH